jgi:hypothetical protein
VLPCHHMLAPAYMAAPKLCFTNAPQLSQRWVQACTEQPHCLPADVATVLQERLLPSLPACCLRPPSLRMLRQSKAELGLLRRIPSSSLLPAALAARRCASMHRAPLPLLPPLLPLWAAFLHFF